MKNLSIAFVAGVIVIFSASGGMCDRLDDAGRSADNAYNYASKAPNTGNLEDARYRSRAAMDASSDARSSAMDARAYGAADSEGRAYDYSRRAANAKSDKDAQFYAKQAEWESEKAMSQINDDIYKKKQAEKSKVKGY